jgi:hypothetical protein
MNCCLCCNRISWGGNIEFNIGRYIEIVQRKTYCHAKSHPETLDRRAMPTCVAALGPRFSTLSSHPTANDLPRGTF